MASDTVPMVVPAAVRAGEVDSSTLGVTVETREEFTLPRLTGMMFRDSGGDFNWAIVSGADETEIKEQSFIRGSS